MAKGISIHVGLDYVDRNHYGVELRLPFCVKDAEHMQKIAIKKGFTSHLLINKNATSRNFFSLIEDAIAELDTNDILFISLSGHGRLIKDVNGDEEAGDSDQAFLMYDRIIIDDQFYMLWVRFKPCVRIIVISDSCYCGTLTKDPLEVILDQSARSYVEDKSDIVTKTYFKHQASYDAVFKNIPPRLQTPILCTVVLLAACQYNQVAGAGSNSAKQLSTFTEFLADCWNDGHFKDSYKRLYDLIRLRMLQKGIVQRPNYYSIGPKHRTFEKEKAFTI